LESEIMRLQEVLKERENEISVLEASLQDKPVVPSVAIEPAPSTPVQDGENAPFVYLSPKTLTNFDNIRKSMANGHDHLENGSEGTRSVSEADESLDRLNELML
jgi:hypothetical protein